MTIADVINNHPVTPDTIYRIALGLERATEEASGSDR